MPDPASSPNKRRRGQDNPEQATLSEDAAVSRKRRAFLQTMGQQLREFGTEGTGPHNHVRSSFDTSPETHVGPASLSSVTDERGQTNPVDTPESDAAPGEDNQLPAGATNGASKWLWREGEVSTNSSTPGVTSYTFQNLLDWSQSYFDHWHPAFPFLHAPSLLDYFRHLTLRSTPIPADNGMFQHIILRSVLSISVIDHRQTPSPLAKALPSNLVFHSFNDAISSVQQVLIEEASILSLQALTSVQLFLISMLRYNAAARLEGLAVRMVFQLRLHRCPMNTGGPQNQDAEIRKRLFWSIFCIDRYICIRLGIPLGIRTEDIDVCYPHAEQHGKAGSSSDRDHRLDLLDFLGRHADIRGSIMELRNRAALEDNVNNDAEAIVGIDAKHTKWWNFVDEYLSNHDADPSVTKLHQVTLIILRFESVIALHRSMLATSKNSAYNAALQRCIFASRSIINTLHKALHGFGAFDGSPGQHGYEMTPLLWPSFTWAVWMSAFIVLFAAAEHQLPHDVARRLTHRSVEILKHLALRGSNWPEACIVGIQNLTARLDNSSKQPARSSTAATQQRKAITTSNMSNPYAATRTSSYHGPTSHTNHSLLSMTQGFNMNDLQNNGRTSLRTNSSSSLATPTNHMSTQDVSHRMPSQSSNALNIDAFTFPASVDPYQPQTLLSQQMTGSGSFLGIAQQLSDNPLPNDEIMHLFNGEDLGFWMNEDFGLGSGN